MPGRPTSNTIGSCPCSIKSCNETAEIREMRSRERGASGVLYLYCEKCGAVRSTGALMQEYIKKHGTFIEGHQPERIETKPAAEPPKPKPDKKPDLWEGW